MASTARILSQDLFALGPGPLINVAYPAVDGVFRGRAAIPLKNHGQSHFNSGQTVIDQRKATGSSYRKAGVGFEFQQGHKVPTTQWEWDVTSHNMINVLRTFFGTSQERFYDNAAGYASGGYFAQFRPFTASQPDRFLTLYRKMSASTADSHQIVGAVASTLELSGAENETFSCRATFVGQDVSYTVNWGTAIGATNTYNTDAFDTSLEPLLWKNAYIAIGSIWEVPPAVTLSISAAGAGSLPVSNGVDLQTLVEPGAYVVFPDSTTLYGPIDSVDSATAFTLQSGTWSAKTGVSVAKIINFINLPSFNVSMSNGLISKAYNNPSIERHIYGDFTGTGSLVIPFSEMNASGDAGAVSPSFAGSNWLKFFLYGGTMKVWLWWGHPFDAVLDCQDDGDFGMCFLIRPTSDSFSDTDGEMGVSIDFQLVGTDYSTGTINSYGSAVAGQSAIKANSSQDFVTIGSDILSTTPTVGVYRGDIVTVYGTSTTSGEIRYVASNNYLYAFATVGVNAAKNYKIESPGIIIQAGYGAGSWKVPGANSNPETLSGSFVA